MDKYFKYCVTRANPRLWWTNYKNKSGGFHENFVHPSNKVSVFHQCELIADLNHRGRIRGRPLPVSRTRSFSPSSIQLVEKTIECALVCPQPGRPNSSSRMVARPRSTRMRASRLRTKNQSRRRNKKEETNERNSFCCFMANQTTIFVLAVEQQT